MLKLIVNADDFGLSETTNEGIKHAHLNGILTSASLMANGIAFEHAVAICRAVPTLDVGIHLTLIEERPVLEPRAVASLVDERGHFPSHATEFTREYFQKKVSIGQIQAELEAQIQKIAGQGIRVSHLDSHQHIHLLPNILKITVELAQKYQIPFIRFPSEPIAPYMWRGKGAVSRVAQLLALRSFCFLGRNSPTLRTDHFAGFFHGGKLNQRNLCEVIKHLPHSGTCELMCHPSLMDNSTKYIHWGYHGADELNALVAPETASLLAKKRIKMVSFRALSNS